MSVRILILGGCGFIGRHLVEHLLNTVQDLEKIRVADKALPQTSFLSPHFEALYNDERVEFKQANLCNPQHVKRAFDDTAPWTFVINLAAETKFGLDEPLYQEKVRDLSINVAREALARGDGLQKYIELSTAQIYDAGKKASKESDKISPWTLQAKYKAEAETTLRDLQAQGLPLVVLRPAIVYGPADVNGLAPRIICAAVYKHEEEKMKFLWSSSLKINTVHVVDVVRAIWHCCLHADSGAVYNLADKSELDQGKFNKILESIFGIRTGFAGDVLSSMAKMRMSKVVNDVNESHMQPWSDLCKKHDVKNTPLSPYLAKELLYKNPLSVDGSAIEASGFTYDVPYVTEDEIRKEVKYYVDLGLFPDIL